MRVLTPGHKYELENFDIPSNYQELQFLHNERVREESTELRIVADGIQNDEVFKMMIDRYKYLQTRVESDSNEKILDMLTMCLELEEQRTRDREKRKVEGKEEK